MFGCSTANNNEMSRFKYVRSTNRQHTARKALTEERLADAVGVDMEKRLDAPNCQVTPLQACNL